VNDENLSLIRKKFPDLSIVARGENLKIKGSKKDLDEFTIIFHSLEKFTTEGAELCA
jgi:phosphate starvation-inducible protein PhoH